jgi:hypothetical protein
MVKLKFRINSYDMGNWFDDKREFEVEIKEKLKQMKKNGKKKT